MVTNRSVLIVAPKMSLMITTRERMMQTPLNGFLMPLGWIPRVPHVGLGYNLLSMRLISTSWTCQQGQRAWFTGRYGLKILLLFISLAYQSQEHRTQYPTIYKLAMDVLPIQGTSIPCECVFSSSKETDTAR